jgi:lysophospholipid acyltransferase (LPLAT)-like uncharacterized protein
VRLVHRTTRWQRLGFAPLEDMLRGGEPAIVVLWHQRLMMSPYLFPLDLAPVCSITSAGRAGSLAGRIQKRMGFQTIAMSSHKRHVALSREVLGRIRAGVSVGIAADGPRGPARVCSTVPLIWARASGVRVFVTAFSTRHASEAPTWDRMLLPRPWSRGVTMCREWKENVPRRAGEDENERLRLSLQDLLNEVTADCDEKAGRKIRAGG